MRRAWEIVTTAIVITAIMGLLALAASAHTVDEQQDWYLDWNHRVADNGGLTTELINEWLDFKERNRPRVVTQQAREVYLQSFIPEVEAWRTLVEAHFGANTNRALAVMQCESRGNAHAKNRYSTASGLFQFLESTWKRVTGEDNHNGVFDGAYNIWAAAKLSEGGTNWREWSCKP